MDLKMPEECDTVYPHRKETGNRTDGFGLSLIHISEPTRPY